MNRVFGVLVTVVLCLIAGCSKSEPIDPTTQNNVTVDVYKSPLPDSAPVVKVATVSDDPPFAYKDEYGNPIGIDIDVIRAVGELEGFKVDLYFEPFDTLFSSVNSGKYDMSIGNFGPKPERVAAYGITKPYFYNPISIIQKQGQPPVQNLRQLAGKRVIAINGSIGEDLIVDAIGQAGEVKANNVYPLMEAVLQDRADAIVGDKVNFEVMAKDFPEYKWDITLIQKDNDLESATVMMTAKQNTELLNSLNQGIDKLVQTGKIQQIKQKWLGGDNKQPVITNQ